MAARSENVLDWLLEREQPAVRYRALIDLVGEQNSSEEARSTYRKIANRGWARDILVAQKSRGYWNEGEESLYTPKYTATNWRMIVLSDLGLTKRNSKVERACGLLFSDWLKDEGAFLEQGEVCIVGNLARMMTRFGYGEDVRIRRLFDWLVADQKDDGGWHCFESDKGTLDCWEALAAFAALPREKRNRGVKRAIERGAEFYLARSLFREGRRYEPWLRFHYPVHYYYDVLVGLDTITTLGYGGDRRLGAALEMVRRKRRTDGTWELDAIHPDIGPGARYGLRGRAIPF